MISTTRHLMSGRPDTLRTTALLAAGVLALGACAGGGSSGSADVADSNAPVVAEPEPTEAPEPEPSPEPVEDDTAPAPEPAPEPSEVETTTTTAPAGTTTAPTTTIPPAADADLPTEAPDTIDAAAPPTTAPGPLPVPEIGLIEVGSFDRPVDLAYRSLDPRSFIVEKGGRVIAFDDESSVTVLDIADVDSGGFTDDGERGLLGLAFRPDTDLAYVNFTNGDGNTIIAEFAIDPTTVVFDPASYREVLTIEQPRSNHNGGDLEFGPNGLLYIATGDGGGSGDPDGNALDLTNRLGKILRIDPAATDGGRPFSVPDDNPFLGADDADPTIWSYGLRNPWKFSFDPLTNDLWIADVGQNEFEEIHLAPAIEGVDAGRALSFGWSAFEGNERFDDDEIADGHTSPVVAYSHDDGDLSVSGGAVARDSSYANLNGWYVYGDFVSGRMWALDTTSVGISDGATTGSPVIVDAGNIPALTAVREGPDGDLYALSLDGQMFRLARA